jgi:hypothetical protein
MNTDILWSIALSVIAVRIFSKLAGKTAVEGGVT